MTKSAYSASMAAIINDGIFNKAQAGLINSGFYVLYGTAQLLGGKLIDRVSPIKMIALALAATAVASFGMIIFDNFYAMLIIWSLCGLAQFAIWPSVLRIIAEYLTPLQGQKAMVRIAFSYCVGMLCNYLFASIILHIWRWQVLFAFNGIILIVSLIGWVIVARKASACIVPNIAPPVVCESEKSNTGFGKILISSGILLLLIPTFVRTSLDFGIKSWLPTMFMESYGIGVDEATAITTALVVVNLAGVSIANFIYPKRVKNIVLAFGLCFAISIPFVVGLMFTGKISLWVALALFIILTTMMYAAHQLLNVTIPTFFRKYNKVGSVAALLNAVASFGIVISSYAFGALAEGYGWTATITTWLVMTVLAAIVCFSVAPIWKRFINK